MNVDILDSGAKWWIYIPITGGAVIVILLLWLFSKFLDGGLKIKLKRARGFNFLDMSRRGSRRRDEEEGIELLSTRY